MLGSTLELPAYFRHCRDLFDRIDAAEVEGLAEALYGAYAERRFVFLCGNGGSGSNASHFCEDLGKSTLDRAEFGGTDVKRLRVLSLTDNTPYILAWANDEGFDCIFVEQLKNLASPGDLLIAISGSGNSRNVLKAVDWANQSGLLTWGVSGYDGGCLRGLAKQSLHVPLDDMGLVESVHLLLFHWVLGRVYARIHAVESLPTQPHVAGRAHPSRPTRPVP